MGTSVTVMDLRIDLLTRETLHDKIKEYLSNDYLNIIYFVSVGLLEKSANDPNLKAILENGDLLIPGEKAVLALHHSDVLETGGMIISFKCMKNFVKRLNTRDKTFYIIARNEEESAFYVKICLRLMQGIQIVGTHCMDMELNDDVIINNINSHAPDVILMAMDSPEQEYWVEANRLKLNAKLCIGIGDIAELIYKENREIPQIFKSLHLESVFNHIVRNGDKQNSSRTRIFKKKIVNYNNKKDE